ncbi:MAG: hypothetical protein IAI50_08310 [Candidatus Eremiobacteraeota bacterium]|nr:hypothetical protein [Candidatus Eremiobacteraeota bacterium]
MARFLLGINYWPRRSAMAMWSRFDLGEIDEDFARIAALGLDVVRFFLLWDDFQPSPERISQQALRQFENVLDRAAAHGVRTMPTLFCGHMSGVNWLPAWTLDPGHHSERFRTLTGTGVSPLGIGDFYAGDLLEAQRTFARAVGERARDHAALFAWDLGNEFSNLRAPAAPAAAAHWSAALTHDLFETSNVGATAGIHGEDVTLDRRIRPSSIADAWKFATMHGYSVYSDFARDRNDPEVVPFLSELTAACARKPVLFSEFGNPTCPPQASGVGGFACLSEDEMSLYAHRVLERLQARGALGAFWWCWADYAPELAATPPFDAAPHELRFGIVRNDGSEKPVARTLAAFARERRPVMPAPPSLVDEATYYAELPGSLARAYDAYVEAYGLALEVS